MKVKIKKLHPDAVIPRKGTQGAAAYDIVANDNLIIPNGRLVFPMDFALEIPYGYEAKIEPRSGHSSKGMAGEMFDCKEGRTRHRFDCDVLIGKIDSDYRGNVGIILHNRDIDFVVLKGTAMAQMTFYKVEDVEFTEVDELSETERGTGGYGSTGK